MAADSFKVISFIYENARLLYKYMIDIIVHLKQYKSDHNEDMFLYK